MRPRQNGRHFTDGIFKCTFLSENVWILIKNSLKFVPKGPINNISTWVQIMAWRRSGDKPLSESMLVSLPTHVCVTTPQWVNGKTVSAQTFCCNCFKDNDILVSISYNKAQTDCFCTNCFSFNFMQQAPEVLLWLLYKQWIFTFATQNSSCNDKGDMTRTNLLNLAMISYHNLF